MGADLGTGRGIPLRAGVRLHLQQQSATRTQHAVTSPGITLRADQRGWQGLGVRLTCPSFDKESVW